MKINMTKLIADLKMTQTEAGLLEASVRTYIGLISQVNISDSTVDALKKNKQLFELMDLLRKLRLLRNTFCADLKSSVLALNPKQEFTLNRPVKS